jgi:hypothetical protein
MDRMFSPGTSFARFPLRTTIEEGGIDCAFEWKTKSCAVL